MVINIPLNTYVDFPQIWISVNLNVLALIKGRKERKRERREKGRNQRMSVSDGLRHVWERFVHNECYVCTELSFWLDFYDNISSHISNAGSPCCLTWRCPLLSFTSHSFSCSHYIFFTFCFPSQLFCSGGIPSRHSLHPPCRTAWWMESGGTLPLPWARLRPAD